MVKVNKILSEYNLDSTKKNLLKGMYVQYAGFINKLKDFDNLNIKYEKPTERE